MPDNIHEMSRAIGSLEASVEAFKETWVGQDREATEGRRILHGKIDEIKAIQGVTTQQVAQLTSEIAEIKPAIKRFEAQRQRSEGGRSMVKILWGGLLAFLAGLGYAAHDLLGFFWPPKH
jgi:uncharacterized small protein (DUF1192 family)